MARRVVSKPALALPPPTGTAANPRRRPRVRGQAPPASRRPPIGRGACVLPGRAPPSPTGTAADPSGALHTSGAWCADVWLGALLQTSSIQGVFRVDFCPVVTNVVNPSAFLLKMLVFGLRLTTFVTEVLARRFELRWFDDVCNVGRPLVARTGLAAAHGHRRLALSASWAGYLKPLSPLRVPAEPRLKPPSPLRARNERFWCSIRAQR